MKTAILSDIHANLEALLACLAHARKQGAEGYAFLGDTVGYGADPVACLDLVMEHCGRGAVAVLGNHDQAALGGLCESMNLPARDAIYWTREQLRPRHREFLGGLATTVRRGDILFVHASAEAPEEWTYVTDGTGARRCLDATDAGVVCAGHVHEPRLYFTTSSASARAHRPTPGEAMPLLRSRRWLAIAGSVGQPRDGNPASSYALIDEAQRAVTFFRVPYDHFTTAAKIRAAGLPERLALRLARGH